MKIQERKDLRRNLLLEIYNDYFGGVGTKSMIKNISKDQNEIYLAYVYLREKELIQASIMSFEVFPCCITITKLTTAGIDAIENNLL